MNAGPADRLLRGLLAAGQVPAEQRAAANRAVAELADPAALADRLSELGLLTRYQHTKLRHLKLGDLLFGPYLICEKIGEGGMGKVYRAVHTDAGVQVALKVVRPHLMANATVQKRYAREAKAAASFDHPNIIKLLAEDTVEGKYFLAMEYVDGSDLSRLVREAGRPPDRGLPDPQEACEYVRQAALGLQHAHDRGFVHRDIKPSNLLAYGDRPLPGFAGFAGLKILDMGLVRRLLGDDDNSRTELTRDGTVVGTPDYMSPEQAKNSRTVDGRADLYSLGCTLYFLLHGRPPFEGGSPIDKLLRHHTEPAPDPRAGRPDVPPGVGKIVLRLMKKNPAERFQSAAAVADALRPFCPGYAPAPAPAGNFSLAPEPSTAPADPPPAAGAAAPRSLRLKVSQAARVPPPRAELTPASDTFAGRQPRTPAGGSPARPRLTPQPPDDLDATLPRFADDDPTPATRRRDRRPVRQKRPVWPLVAAGVAAVLLLGVAALVVSRDRPSPVPSPTPPTQPDKPPAPAAPPADPVADGATAVLSVRPKPVADRLPAAGRLAQLARGWATQAKFDAARLDRLTVSLVGGSPPDAVAAGHPDGQIGTDPTLTAAVAARRAAGRAATGLSADLLAARAAAGETGVATFAAGGRFALPGGETLAQNKVTWAAAAALLDGDRLAVTLTVAGPDRAALTDFLNIRLATRLPAEVPALKPVCERLAAEEPNARRTAAGLEMTVRFRVELAELLDVVERLLTAE